MPRKGSLTSIHSSLVGLCNGLTAYTFDGAVAGLAETVRPPKMFPEAPEELLIKETNF
jgi:hypothetical protein